MFVVGGLVAIGVPIAFCFGFATLSYLALTTSVPLNTVVGRMDEGISNLVLLAVPLFVLLGLLIENAGIAKRLVDAFASVIGHVRGGLGIVLLGAMYLVSGISGSKVADMAAVAPVLFPEMERRGQKRAEMISLLAASGAMAETIPPSLVLIIIGSVTGVSISALFTAGLLPALVAAIALVFVTIWRSKDDRTELADPADPGVDRESVFRRDSGARVAAADSLLRPARYRDGDRGQHRRHRLHACSSASSSTVSSTGGGSIRCCARPRPSRARSC